MTTPNPVLGQTDDNEDQALNACKKVAPAGRSFPWCRRFVPDTPRPCA
jgi:hypothetical protein